MATYNFEQLLEDLKIGREIEFIFDNNNYSITNSSFGWQFCCQNAVLLGSYKTVNELVEKLNRYQIKNQIGINEVFNDSLYENGSLYIL